jgi:hypothetical protein
MATHLQMEFTRHAADGNISAGELSPAKTAVDFFIIDKIFSPQPI